MTTLERLFLSCLVLFGMFIMFMLGLYFDLGEMFTAWLRQDEVSATSMGTTDYLVRLMEKQHSRAPVAPSHLGEVTGARGDEGLTEDDVATALAGYCGAPVPLTGKELTQVRKAELQNQGFKREDFIEMESLYMDQDAFVRVMTDVKRMVSARQVGAAIKIVEEALAATAPRNLAQQKDLLAMLMQLQLDDHKIDEAKATCEKMYMLLDRILTIRSVAYKEVGRPGLEASSAALKAQRARMEHMFTALAARQQKTGSIDGMTAEEKDKMRAELTRAHQEGRLTKKDLDAALEQLEKPQ